MIESTYALYKLIVLYMLDRVSYPLTNAQISEFFLEKEYTTYFRLQEVLNEMKESDLLTTHTVRNTTFYRMTDNGEQTLHFFKHEISAEIRSDTDSYLKEHAYEMRTDSSIRAEYVWSDAGGYTAHCIVRENGTNLIDLTLSVPTETIAQEVCDNWKKKSQDVYSAVIKLLM